jgi:hypothetical protein
MNSNKKSVHDQLDDCGEKMGFKNNCFMISFNKPVHDQAEVHDQVEQKLQFPSNSMQTHHFLYVVAVLLFFDAACCQSYGLTFILPCRQFLLQ